MFLNKAYLTQFLAAVPSTPVPVWSVVPFVAMLLAIAVLPLAAGHWWESNRHRGYVAAALGLPVVLWLVAREPQLLHHTLWEYAAFVILLGALYVISSGIVIRGGSSGTPAQNTFLLLAGALLASCIGTTGASMLLIRPLLRANAGRQKRAHLAVFFIFIVSNIGGLLTPLGDPPLFLGFLRGVPFGWTLRLWPQWAFANGVLLLLFYLLDRYHSQREPTITAGSKSPLQIAGGRNLLFLALMVGIILISGSWNLPAGCSEIAMLATAALAWRSTPAQLRQENAFSWGPMVEVAVVFAGIFATMPPALLLLNERGAALGLEHPWQFFWATGLLSSVLDNAPTYLTFTAAASSLLHTDGQALWQLVGSYEGARLLAAISVGAVMMGANTYLGNGPNFMVKAVAEQSGLAMPSFFGYMAYSGVILLPLFGVISLIFF